MDDSQLVEMTRASNQNFGSGTKGQRFESSRAYFQGCCKAAFSLSLPSFRLHLKSGAKTDFEESNKKLLPPSCPSLRDGGSTCKLVSPPDES